MHLFRVTMTGLGFQLRMENAAPIDAGFVKNHFVLANSAEEAGRRAIDQVQMHLRAQAEAGGVLLKDVSIEVDEIARSKRFWKLVQQEGFVFFPQESDKETCTPPLH